MNPYKGCAPHLFGSHDIGIDLGTASVIIYIKGKGIVLREPSVVALDRASGRILAVGEEAHRMLGRTPAGIVTVRPLREGVISNYDATEKMLRYFLRRVIGQRMILFRPRVVVCVPTGVTEVEKRSVVEAALDAGARYAQLIEEPIAAAIGAGLDITRPQGCMIVDVGGGTCDIAVISMGTAVVSSSIKVAGDAFNDAIIRYIRKNFNVLLGEQTAEQLKVGIGCAAPREEVLYMEATGRNLISGLPRTIRVSSDDIALALEEPVFNILDCIHSVLEQTPPELAADIFERGIVMTGGGSLLYNMSAVVTERIHVPCVVAPDAVSCVALGTGRVLEDPELLERAAFEYQAGSEYLNY